MEQNISLRREVHKLKEEINELIETSKTIMERIYNELSRNYGRYFEISHLNEYTVEIELFGNKIRIKADVLLTQEELSGRISCNLHAPDEDAWVLLNTVLSFGPLGNVNQHLTAYESAHIILKSLITELKEKKVTVKPKLSPNTEIRPDIDLRGGKG